MAQTGKLSPHTRRLLKKIDELPDIGVIPVKRLKLFLKILALAKECGINPWKPSVKKRASTGGRQ